MANVKLAPPWASFYREIVALFREDPDVSRITYDEENLVIKIYVEDQDKAEALTKILPNRKTFGNVELKIIVVPANLDGAARAEIIRKAFDKNPIVRDIVHMEGIMAPQFDYVVFRADVVQYFNDDLSDVDGKRSCLFEDIAKEVIGEDDGVCFCTESTGNEILNVPPVEYVK